MARRKRTVEGSFAGAALVPFLDLALLLGVICLYLATISLPHVNDPPKGEDAKRSVVDPTALFVQVSWTLNAPHDVDTYLKCTSHLGGRKHVSSVNFKQKNAAMLDLVVDDLGKPSVDNYERVLSNSAVERMLPNTVCQLNAHLYSSHGGTLPLLGTFHVILNKDDVGTERQLTPETGQPFVLSFKGEEVTLMELIIDETGLVYDEATSLYPEAPTTCIATC